MKILITGSSSFVAQNLSKFLNSLGFTIYGLGRSKTNNPLYVKEYLYNDLKDITLDDMDAVIHLAAKVHDTNNEASYKDFYEVNVGLTKEIFDKFVESKLPKFIFMSSIAVIGDVEKDTVITELTETNPTTDYGKTKLDAEKYIINNCPKDKKFYILRPAMIYGEGNKGNLNLLFNLMSKGIPYPLGCYDNKRSFIAIENLDFIIAEIVKKEVKSGIYNISDDTPYSTKEIIELMASVMNKKEKIWNFPKSIIKLIAKCGDTLKLPLNTNRLQKLTQNLFVANDKIKKELEISKLPHSSRESMIRTIKFLNDNK